MSYCEIQFQGELIIQIHTLYARNQGTHTFLPNHLVSSVIIL